MDVRIRLARLLQWMGPALLAATVFGSGHAAAQPAGIEPRATELLKRSTSYLASLKRFSVDTTSTLEAVLTSGQRIAFEHVATLTVQRPDKLKAERKGDLVRQVMYVDGKSIVLHNAEDGFYATFPAAGTIEQALDVARISLDLYAPASDLLHADAYDILMQDVTTGFVVGKSVIDGVRCDHLAFRSPHADWQIWIEEGKRPLPRKLAITSRDVKAEPQFVVRMQNWNLSPAITAATFEFRPPKYARQVEFLVLRDGSKPK